MNILDNFNQLNLVIESLSVTILHSLWQGIMLAVLLGFTLKMLKNSRSQVRYLASVSTLMLLTASFAITFGIIYTEQQTATSAEDLWMQVENLEALTVGEATGEKETLTAQLQAFYHEFYWNTKQYAKEIFAIWLVGIAIFSFRFVSGLFYIQRLKNSRHRHVPMHWESKLHELAQKLNIRKRVRLVCSPKVSAPTLAGWVRPIILLPVSMMSQTPVAELEGILAHELAHIKRHDYLINILQSMVEILLFFNPAAWWISACVNEERENCCDDIALQITGNVQIYVKALANAAYSHQAPPALALSVIGKKGSLLYRIRRIVASEKEQRPVSKVMSGKVMGRFAAASLVLCSLIFLTVSSGYKMRPGVSAEELSPQPQEVLAEIPEMQLPWLSLQSALDSPIKEIKFTADTITIRGTGNAKTELLWEERLFIVDGERMPAEKGKVAMLEKTSSDQITRVDILNGEKAMEIYGQDAKHGAIVITTKSQVKDAPTAPPNPSEELEDKNLVYIIDGKEFSQEEGKKAMEKLEANPENIVRIDILKNEQASEAYGDEAKEGVIRITTKAGQAQTTIPSNVSLSIKGNNEPLYVIDGKRLSHTEGKEVVQKLKSAALIQEVKVLKGAMAVERFGEEAREGVIVINSKITEEKAGLEDKKPTYIFNGVKLSEKDGKELVNQVKQHPEKYETIEIFKGEAAKKAFGEDASDVVYLIQTKKGNAVDDEKSEALNAPPKIGVGFKGEDGKVQPLFVVDGKKIGKTSELSEINPNEIKSINVLKGENATEKYGEEGKDGVVEIFLKNKGKVYEVADRSTRPKGGFPKFYDHIRKNSPQTDIDGKIYVQFVVNTDGSVSDLKVIRGLDPELDRQAISLVETGPKWIPGEKDGKKVRQRMVMPIPTQVSEKSDEKESKLKPRGSFLTELPQEDSHETETAIEVQPSAFANSLSVYPNPSESVAYIGFRLEQAERVQVKVFDITGKKLANVADKTFQPGIHQVSWDASRAENGLYIVQVEKSGETISQKLMIEK